MFLLKIHVSEKGNVVAACDSELVGKTFSNDEFCLDVDEHFFGGEKADITEIVLQIKLCTTSNIVGNNIIRELLALGVIKAGGIREISGVKYAMIFRL